MCCSIFTISHRLTTTMNCTTFKPMQTEYTKTLLSLNVPFERFSVQETVLERGGHVPSPETFFQDCLCRAEKITLLTIAVHLLSWTSSCSRHLSAATVDAPAPISNGIALNRLKLSIISTRGHVHSKPVPPVDSDPVFGDFSRNLTCYGPTDARSSMRISYIFDHGIHGCKGTEQYVPVTIFAFLHAVPQPLEQHLSPPEQSKSDEHSKSHDASEWKIL